MSERLNPDDFGLKIYNRFPPSYRMDDVSQNYALKRYIETASDGGFKHIIDEQNGLLDLVNPQTAPLDVVFQLYKQYGLGLYHGIPEKFARALLPDLSTAWSKKGSLDVIEHVVSSLSGVKTDVELIMDSKGVYHIIVRLEMDYNASDYFPEMKHVNRILKYLVPFYCDATPYYLYVYEEGKENAIHYDGEMQSYKIRKTQTLKGDIAWDGDSFLHESARYIQTIEGVIQPDYSRHSFLMYHPVEDVAETIGTDVHVVDRITRTESGMISAGNNQADRCHDRIIFTTPVTETIGIHELVYDSYLNNTGNLLNDNFYLNPPSHIDIFN